MSRKFAHEKNAARDRARRTRYQEPVPKYCPRLVPAEGSRRMARCGGELHEVSQLRGEPVLARTTICEKCHHVTVYGKGDSVPSSTDARKKASALANELDRSGVLIEESGAARRVAVALEGKHWKVRALNGAYLYSFSTTPSDHRSVQNTVSALRKMNVRWGDEAKEVLSNGDGAKKKSSPPSDTELSPIQQRGIAVRARLSTLQKTLGATNTDLVKVGMDAAKKRKLWHYKTTESGVVQIGRFLNGKTYGEHRTLDFFEAACDELEGVPPKQFGTATEPAVSAPAQPAAPEPTPEPVPAPAPEGHLDRKIAALTQRLKAGDSVINELKDERSKLIEKFEKANEQIGAETKKTNELREQLERQRSETIGAQSHVRALKEELDDVRRQLDERGAPQSDDPLFIKALRRLITNSSTDQEIEEAFEMAMQIYRGTS